MEKYVLNKLRIILITLGCLFASNQALAVPNYSVDQNPMPGAQVTTTYNHNAGGWGITPAYGYYVTEFPSLNDYGFIAGRTDVANSPDSMIKGRTSGQAAVWENGITKNITFFNACRDRNGDGIADASGCGSRALAISNQGQVGGSTNVNRPAVDNYFERSIAWWPSRTGEYDEGGTRPLSSYTPSQSQIEDINNQSNVVGTGITPGGGGPKDGLAHGLVNINGDQDYIGIQFQQSRAHALNENNLVTGAILWNDTDDYSYGVPRSLKAYTWFSGELNVVQDDITDPAHVSEGYDVNDSGLVVGLMGWNNAIRAFKWSSPNGNLEDLGTLGGTQSIARSVNNAGTVVGWADVSYGTRHAFVYENGTMYDLNDYVSDDSGFVIVDAYSINEAGQILVRAYNKSTMQNQYWLLTDPDSLPSAPPEPEPAPVNVESMGVFGGKDDEVPLKIMADGEGNTISIGYYNTTSYIYSKRWALTIDFDPSLAEDIQTLGKLQNKNRREIYIQGVYIQKLDANGNYLWTKTLPGRIKGTFGDASVKDLFVEPDGSFHIVGVVEGGYIDINPDPKAQEYVSDGSSFRASYSPHGYLISSSTVPYADAMSIAVDSDKNIYVAYKKGREGGVRYVRAQYYYSRSGYTRDIDFDPGDGVVNVQLKGDIPAIVVTKTSRDSSGVERLEWAKSMPSIGMARGTGDQSRKYDDNYAWIQDVSIAAPAIAGEGPMLAFTYKGEINFQAYDSNLGLLGDSQIVGTEGVFRSGFIRMSESEKPSALWMIPEGTTTGATKVKLVRSGDYFGLMTRTKDGYFNNINDSHLFHGMAENAGINHISRTLKGDSKGIGMNQRGDVYISGYTYNPVNFDPARYDMQGRLSSYVTKINTDGSYGWTFSHRGTGGTGYTSVAPDRFGNVTMTGVASTSNATPELLDHNGNVLSAAGGKDVLVTRISPATGSTTGIASTNPADLIATSITLSQSALPGEAATYTITVTSLGDTTGQVNLSLDALDTGITATLADTSLTPPVGGSITTILTVTADANVTDDSYSVRVLVADEADQIYSSVVVTLKILRPDFDISFSPQTQQLNPGDSTTYEVVFTSIDGFSSTFAISTVSPHASVGVSVSPAQVILQPDGTAIATITVSTNVATPVKFYSFKVIATDGQNTRHFTAKFYFRDVDLVLTEVSTPDSQIYAGDSIDLKLTVRNIGDPRVVGPKVSVYLSNDATITTEDIRIASINFRRLNGGSSRTWEPWRGINIPSSLAAGTYYLGAIVDPENWKVESNEDNNVRVASTALQVKAEEIDLLISSVSIQDSQVDRNSYIDVKYTLSNQGGSPALDRRFMTGIYLSSDATITTADILIGERRMYRLNGGKSYTRTSRGRIPARVASGIYYLGVIADYKNRRSETNEDNNVGVAGATLQVGDALITRIR